MLEQKWFYFTPRLVLRPLLKYDRICDCPITLVLHNFHRAACHFNLLQPINSCCLALIPANEYQPPVLVDLELKEEPSLSNDQSSPLKTRTVPCPSKPKTISRKSKPKNTSCLSKHKTIFCETKQEKLANENIAKNVGTSTVVRDEQFHQRNNFKDWKVKDLKEYISDRGVPTTNYLKSDLIKLAEATEEAKLPIDPDFSKDSLEHCLQERLTLPAGKRLQDPFKMTCQLYQHLDCWIFLII